MKTDDEVYALKSFDIHESEIVKRDLRGRFQYIHEVNLWGNEESVSGPGSSLEETVVLRENLPVLLRNLEAQSMLDIPCGDFAWMQHVPFELYYIGADIVPNLIERNREKWPEHEWHVLDLTTDSLPQADVVFVRDCLVHLSHENVFRALDNIRRSGAKWLCTTWFRFTEVNTDIQDGDWRPLNLMVEPFLLPHPEYFIVEECKEANAKYVDDKCMAVWKLRD